MSAPAPSGNGERGAVEAVLGRRVGVFSDVHGATRTLGFALETCRAEGVETIVLLGDLFDRPEQADGCAAVLAGWSVVGVYGNHERDIALAAAEGAYDLLAATIALLSRLQEEVHVDDVRLTHDLPSWGMSDPLARMLARRAGVDVTDVEDAMPRITFTGHTHFRQARDQHGLLDIARGTLRLDPARRYLLNPGALMIGQYGIWDRDEGVITFRNVEQT